MGGVLVAQSKFVQEQQWAERSAKRRQLMVSALLVSPHQRLRGCCCFCRRISFILFLFWQPGLGAGVVVSLTAFRCLPWGCRSFTGRGGGGKKSHQMEDDQTDSRRCHRGWRDPYPQISCSQTVLLYLQILAFSLWLVDNQMGPLLDLNAETQCKCFDERVGAMLKGVTSITGRPLYLQADKRP